MSTAYNKPKLEQKYANFHLRGNNMHIKLENLRSATGYITVLKTTWYFDSLLALFNSYSIRYQKLVFVHPEFFPNSILVTFKVKVGY